MIVGSVQSEHPSRAMDGELVIIDPDRSKVARLPQDTFSSLRDAIDSWRWAELCGEKWLKR